MASDEVDAVAKPASDTVEGLSVDSGMLVETKGVVNLCA